MKFGFIKRSPIFGNNEIYLYFVKRKQGIIKSHYFHTWLLSHIKQSNALNCILLYVLGKQQMFSSLL